MYKILFSFVLTALIASCGKKIKVQEDEIYSSHLQHKVMLTILNTPVPSDKEDLNLLIMNDGQDFQQLHMKEILDSLWKKKLIQPLLVVGVHAGDREQEYGVADKPDNQNRGSRANYYDAFVDDELYFFIKKKVSIRKFKSVAITGSSLGGLSAFDIAWNHPNKIDKVGVFSGSFWWRDKDVADSSYDDNENRIMYEKIKSSRKKPKLQYWFYAGGKEENGDRDKDGVIDVIDDTQDLINLMIAKKVCSSTDITFKQYPNGEHNQQSWSHQLPDFLIWAFGK
ncbi:MAG: esterase family protein [Sphingobacteriales bacterium]|nr:esterase family protein [Sphingobacteriales bacterium]MBI3720050.1 esterase family protein [Sphingobacteriales bacterium]